MSINDIINRIDQKARENVVTSNTYTEKGLLMCSKCNTHMEYIDPHGNKRICTCQCQQDEENAYKMAIKNRNHLERVEKIKKDGITHDYYLRCTFENSNSTNTEQSIKAEFYANNWNEMKKENIGIIIMGSVGTGKSYLACCIANALAEKEIKVKVVNFAILLEKAKNYKTKDEYINELNKYDLLVIDDFGININSNDTNALTCIYCMIEQRNIDKKPLIITTNMSAEEFKNPQKGLEQSIERIKEICSEFIIFDKPVNRRASVRKEKQEYFKKLYTSSLT